MVPSTRFPAPTPHAVLVELLPCPRLEGCRSAGTRTCRRLAVVPSPRPTRSLWCRQRGDNKRMTLGILLLSAESVGPSASRTTEQRRETATLLSVAGYTHISPRVSPREILTTPGGSPTPTLTHPSCRRQGPKSRMGRRRADSDQGFWVTAAWHPEEDPHAHWSFR